MNSDNRDDPDQLPLRPIPDGGLKRAMPEWLKRPPTWSGTGATNVTEPVTPPSRTLPPPETAPIDPRSLVSVADLPEWLQDLARRERSERREAAPQAEESRPEETTRAMSDQKFSRTALETEPTPPREVKLESQKPQITNVDDGKVEKYGGGKRGFELTMPLILAALLIAALLIWALLTFL